MYKPETSPFHSFFIFVPFAVLVVLLCIVSAAFAAANPEFSTAKPGITDAAKDAMGICPPFYLRDEQGRIINPLKGINADVPYSPEKTCGQCHDYNKITKGYHFQLGRDEKITETFSEIYPWTTSYGQYGGRW